MTETHESADVAAAAQHVIAHCVDQLGKSERGRDLAAGLRMLLGEHLANADPANWNAVMLLMANFRGGHAGTVLSALARDFSE